MIHELATHLIHEPDHRVDQEAAEEKKMVNVIQVKLPSLETEVAMRTEAITNSDELRP